MGLPSVQQLAEAPLTSLAWPVRSPARDPGTRPLSILKQIVAEGQARDHPSRPEHLDCRSAPAPGTGVAAKFRDERAVGLENLGFSPAAFTSIVRTRVIVDMESGAEVVPAPANPRLPSIEKTAVTISASRNISAPPFRAGATCRPSSATVSHQTTDPRSFCQQRLGPPKLLKLCQRDRGVNDICPPRLPGRDL